jgi:serine/threonine-protein kinase
MGEIFLSEGPTPRGTGVAALKRLLPQAKADPLFIHMFLDEGRLAKHLSHPNVCQVYAVGEDGEHFYIAMEWVDGVSLKQLIARGAGRGGLPVPVTARILADTASALDYAHRLRDEQGRFMGVVHRDVSPPNVMVDLRGRVKLLDFGMAKARTQLAKTQPGYVKGKFGYLAPEQLTGDVDARTDVFALGLCLYEAFTGRAVFDQETAAETIANINAFRGPPKAAALNPAVFPELDAIIQRACAPDKEQRFQSAGEMRNAILAALDARGELPEAADIERLVRELFPERKPLVESVRPPSHPPPEPAPLEVDDILEDDIGTPKRGMLVAAIVVFGLICLAAAAAILLN